VIQIRRAAGIPVTLSSEAAVKAQVAIRAIASVRKPKSEEFEKLWGKTDVRKCLWEMQHHKCAYCERIRDWNRESDIEHFRPRAIVTGAKPEHKGYWWLAYTWANLFFSCRICNQEYKKNKFPLEKEENRVMTDAQDLSEENALFIDPCLEEPEKLLTYDWGFDPFVWVIARQNNNRGHTTLTELGLNRKELLEERAAIIVTLDLLAIKMDYARHTGNNKVIEEVHVQIREETKSERQFAGFRREFFRKRGLGAYISED
jgi:uncharacterized protein (TIGR02646 family)